MPRRLGALNPRQKPPRQHYLRKPEPQFRPVKPNSLATQAAFALGLKAKKQ
jgi:hypothetical protein